MTECPLSLIVLNLPSLVTITCFMLSDATPVNTVDTPKKGAESEPGLGMDSTGDQSSDSNKEGKRKGRFRFGRGGKKKKESTPTADNGTDPDNTPIQPSLEERA